MKRNQFNKVFASIPLLGLASHNMDFFAKSSEPEIDKIIPNRLKKGDTIGLIAPASSASDDAYKRALKNISDLGFKYKLGQNLLKKNGYLAGSDAERANDINSMFADDEVNAVWCIRGGYGITRIINDIDYDIIKSNPKVLIGYSDITALHLAINKMTGLITFHGPVASSEFTPYTKENFINILVEGGKIISNTSEMQRAKGDIYSPYIINPGEMKGKLVGGNLCLLSALAGTKYDFDASGKIVFIEDIDEKPYRIDRMLTQLLDASNLQRASGIILGVMKGCEKVKGDNSWTLEETLKDRLGDLNIPVYYGFSFGHIKNNCTLPVGAEAVFNTDEQKLMLLEDVVR
ncbi:MAG: LD-carboxypeptidase [Saprospiraceae bacterium]